MDSIIELGVVQLLSPDLSNLVGKIFIITNTPQNRIFIYMCKLLMNSVYKWDVDDGPCVEQNIKIQLIFVQSCGQYARGCLAFWSSNQNYFTAKSRSSLRSRAARE